MPTKTATKKSTPKTKAKKVVKKAVPKKAVKRSTASTKKATTKTSAKKATKRGSTKKPMVYAVDEKSFWVTNGEILNSLVALKDALTRMEKEVYQYHATGGQNDFAVWVDAVLCDQACAADLSKAKTPSSAKTAVVRHLKHYDN
jgi:hypothetical protein